MAMTSFPFDGQDTTENQYSRLFSELQDSGVAASVGSTALAVSADGTDLHVSIAPGFAYVRGHAFESTAVERLPIPVPSSGTAIHRVVLRLDPAANSILPVVLEGTAGAGITPLTQGQAGIYELPLARVQVSSGAVAINPGDVVDERVYASLRVGVWMGEATRPTNPREGQMGYNASLGFYEQFSAGAWEPLSDAQTGDIKMRGSSTVPAGWLPCDGALYDSAQYPRLAAELGRSNSLPEDPAGTFRTPPINDAFPFGASAEMPVGTTGGAAEVAIGVEHLPEHDHDNRHDHGGYTATDGKHDHGYRVSTDDGATTGTLRSGRVANSSVRPGDLYNGVMPDGSDHRHKIPAETGRTGKTGSGMPLSILPPLVALNFVIKA